MSYDFTVVIPFYNGHDELYRLLSTLPEDMRVIVVDDHSSTSVQVADRNCTVIRPNKKGYFSGAVNAGIQACSTDILVLNQDVWFEGISWIDMIMQNKSKYAMIGERIKGHHPAWPNGYIHGTFMYMRGDAIRSVGLLNTVDYPLWGSTCEWQARACRKGFKVLPLETIPGFNHGRPEGERFGKSIKQLLKDDTSVKDLMVRTPPMISIIVSCYNYGRYLKDLVNSFIGGETCLGYTDGQTFQSFEIVIVDDCSTDNSYELAKALEDPWKGISVVKTPKNGGTAFANNYGISKSHGKYVTIMCADDMRENKSLELLYRASLENPHSFIYDDMRIVTNRTRMKTWKMADFDFPSLIHKNQIHCGIMFPYEAWKEVGGYPDIMRDGREDWAYNVALGMNGYCGIHIDYAGYLYRREGQNRTLTNTNPKARTKFLGNMKDLYPKLYKGEFPMGCCGGRKAGEKVGQKLSSNGGTTMLAGTEGMTILKYTGKNHGHMTFFGPVTGTMYVFSVKRNRRMVDDRDLRYTTNTGKKIGLLEMTDNNKRIFVVDKPAPTPQPAPVPVPVAQPVPESELQAVAVAEIAPERVSYEILDRDAEVEVEAEIEVVEETESDLYSTNLDNDTVKYLMDNGYDSIASILDSTIAKMRKDLGYTSAEVRELKTSLK